MACRRGGPVDLSPSKVRDQISPSLLIVKMLGLSCFMMLELSVRNTVHLEGIQVVQNTFWQSNQKEVTGGHRAING